MSTKQPEPRPWYCADALVKDYKVIGAAGGDLEMLKSLKIIRSIVVNLGIIAIALYALMVGADPTIVASVGLSTLGLYNGIEVADYQALAQAIVEMSHDSQSTDEE